VTAAADLAGGPGPAGAEWADRAGGPGPAGAGVADRAGSGGEAAVAAGLAGLSAALGELARVRGRAVLLVHGALVDGVPRLVRDALPAGPVDLVLVTGGGSPTVAARVAALLPDPLAVLVPGRARSAGTLLALAATELVLTPLAELGPLDPLVEPPGGPPVSAADVRAFRAAAAALGVPPGPELLALLCQRVAPTALARLHRLDGLVRALAARHLARSGRAGPALVDRLVAGYPDHDYPILPAEAAELGLPVRPAGPAEEAALLRVADAAEAVLAAADTAGTPLATLVRSEEVPA
jgi:hypothetical protein